MTKQLLIGDNKNMERTYPNRHRNYWIQQINKRNENLDKYDLPPCRHGHFHCAISEDHDDCTDEIISVYELTDEDCDI